MEFPRKNNSGEDESELREKHSLDDDNFLLISSTPQQSHRNQVMNRRYFNGSQTTINITNESSLDRNFSESNSNVDKAHINTDELFNRLLYPKHRKNAIVEICECIKNDKNNSLNMGYFIFGRPGISAAFCLEIFEHYPYDKRVPLSPASFEVSE
ncbi:unnamed protein product [Trichobilharzia regenti]|uniref:Uncharacterized protein n=1 Tax=Trichobilharzia regenti TaxID=157069 RepID=A0A183W8A4_TRIRE|nr:unnamed protein product [Trichobilharzia regenti]VDQ04236.1 unnamed protein product [Trichobilharzia regenti]